MPPHVIRQMRRQEAVLLHGTLPPIHLQAVLWWQDNELRKLVGTDDQGRPVVPEVSTCPLTDTPAETAGPMLDPATLEESLSRLPPPQHAGVPQRADGHSGLRTESPASPDRPASTDEWQLPVSETRELHVSAPGRVSGLGASPESFDADEEPEPNRVAEPCARCGTWLTPGTGEVAEFGTREVVRCTPACR